MDVSCIILSGPRLPPLHATIRAARRAVARLEEEGGSAEMILVAQADNASVAEMGNMAAGAALRVLILDDKDPVALWLAAAKQARGRFLSFAEAGDMWSSNWLSDSLRAARRERRRLSVWRPEMVLVSGRDYFSMHDLHAHLQPQLAKPSEGAALMMADLYAPAFLTHRDVLAAVERPRPDAARGWGDSRAWWAANALVAGHAHRIVEGTVLYRWDRPPAGPAPVRIGPTPLADASKGGDGR